MTERLSAADEIAYLASPRAIRERAAAVHALVADGASPHFALDEARLPAVVDRVLAVVRARYPDLAAIPYHSRWRHFGAGGVDRAADFDRRLAGASDAERLRARFDLVITSVLLDAGAGGAWSLREPGTGAVFARSEGLAVASYHAFLAGTFSGAPARSPLRADGEGLAGVTEAALATAFQATADNPVIGLGGRVALLRRLGEEVASSEFFADGDRPTRVGNLADFLVRQATAQRTLPARVILAAVLGALGPIWPGRPRLEGVSLGDVWPHPRVGWVPFHKLSQWLTYSLVEPLEQAGLRVVELDELTGLAEYRNGGLFLDGGVIVPKHDAVTRARHEVGAPVVVEWRALTIALLDRVAEELRRRLGLSATELPLAKVLEGGTWTAGRELARERRPDGGPPISVQSDGTVF